MSTDPQTAARRWRGLAAAAGVVALAVAVLLAVLLGGRDTVTFDVPDGAAARIEAGEPLRLLPATIDLEVGDSIRIRNRDSVAHTLGPFVVEAGQELEQTFTSAGTFGLTCSLRPEGSVLIHVVRPDHAPGP